MTWNHKLSSWYSPLFKSKIQFSKAAVKTTSMIASAQIQVERKIEQIEENLNSARCHAWAVSDFAHFVCKALYM